MKMKMLSCLALATALLITGCAQHDSASHSHGKGDGGPHTKNISISGPTVTPVSTPGVAGYVVVDYATGGGCSNCTWSVGGGSAYSVGPTARLFSVGTKTLTVTCPGQPIKSVSIVVTDETKAVYKISCN